MSEFFLAALVNAVVTVIVLKVVDALFRSKD